MLYWSIRLASFSVLCNVQLIYHVIGRLVNSNLDLRLKLAFSFFWPCSYSSSAWNTLFFNHSNLHCSSSMYISNVLLYQAPELSNTYLLPRFLCMYGSSLYRRELSNMRTNDIVLLPCYWTNVSSSMDVSARGKLWWHYRARSLFLLLCVSLWAPCPLICSYKESDYEM